MWDVTTWLEYLWVVFLAFKFDLGAKHPSYVSHKYDASHTTLFSCTDTHYFRCDQRNEAQNKIA